jgi:predicted nucleic-acid-binding protein
MEYLTDTNLLVRAAQDGHAMQDVALSAIEALLDEGQELFLARQNLVEFWVVATRPVERNGLGMTAPWWR